MLMTALARKVSRIGAVAGVLTACLALAAPAHAQTAPAAKALVDQARDAAGADLNVDALAAYAGAIAAAPDDPAVHAARAYQFELMGEPVLAARDYRAAAKLKPDDAGVQAKVCLYLTLTNHDLDGALEACDAAVRAAPLDAVALGTRGYVHLRRAEYEKAEKDYQASLAQSSASPDEMFGLGVAMIHLGRIRQGREQIASATLDSAGLVDQWQARGFGSQGEVVAGAARTTASQAALSVSDHKVFLNKGEAYVALANGCGRVVAPGAQVSAGAAWSGACRFGLAHGEGAIGASGGTVRFVYGREIAAGGNPALEHKLGLAYQAAEQALSP